MKETGTIFAPARNGADERWRSKEAKFRGKIKKKKSESDAEEKTDPNSKVSCIFFDGSRRRCAANEEGCAKTLFRKITEDFSVNE